MHDRSSFSTACARAVRLAQHLLINAFMAASKNAHTPAAPFDSRQLRVLYTLSTEPSLSATARKLHLTQSAISHALKNLEADAGMTLVERGERGAQLTQAGQALAQRAEAIFYEMELAREQLARLKNWGTQRLRFGASSTACQYLLPAVLSRFSSQNPKCKVEVSAGDSSSRLAALRAGDLDLAIITHTGMDADDLSFIQLMREELCLVAPPMVSVNKKLAFIGYQKTSSLSQDALLWFDLAQRPRPEPRMELESLEAIKAMVKLGQGYAVLPYWVVRAEEEAKELLVERLPEPLHRIWSLVMRRSHRPNLSEESWIKLCLNEAQQL
jgi:LysR family transcriptional regulator, low CO2-responsive transcriptional regulator